MTADIHVRRADPTDQDAIWDIIHAVIATGDTYVFPPNSAKAQMLAYWCDDQKNTYVATIMDRVVGTFFIQKNHIGLGAHIANASFMTHPTESGQGVGYAMGLYALEEARLLGYRAMQFNLVVQTNEGAIRLWKRLGFDIIGEIPKAFDHQQFGLVNAYIMWRAL